MRNKGYLYFTVFVSGMTTLAIELSASRLLGSVFGVSNLVWASIIGLILIYLTAGYFLGGRWADRSPNPKTMYQILAWGAFSAGLVPLLAKPVLPFAADAFDELNIGVLAGSFVGVLILFSVPVTLLGTISPFAIRLAIRDEREAGRISGEIYGISTIGSFLGTFLPILVLIPLVGTTYTFLIFSLFLVLVAFVGLWVSVSVRAVVPLLWMPMVLLIMAVFWAESPFKKTIGQIYETESAYNYIEVLEQDHYRMLRLNEGQGIHSIYHPEVIQFYGPWMQFLAAPFFNPDFDPQDVERIAIVGLAAGTTARQATAAFGPIPIDGFEIDAEIIEIGRTYFGMDMPNLIPIAQDGRWGLHKQERRYSLIAIDAYRAPYIPWHLTTQEFFQLVEDHLTEEGVAALNVGRAPRDRRLIEGLVGTMSTIFPSVYVMDVPGTFNSVIYATARPTDTANLFLNMERLKEENGIHPILIEAMERALIHMQPTPESEMVFTDEHAPIEFITNNMVLSFLLEGGAEELK